MDELELSTLLFKGEEKTAEEQVGVTTIEMFYATALEDSKNGSVLIQIDTPIYADDDVDQGDWEEVDLSDDSEDWDEEDDEYEEEESEVVDDGIDQDWDSDLEDSGEEDVD